MRGVEDPAERVQAVLMELLDDIDRGIMRGIATSPSWDPEETASEGAPWCP